jgi:hypothetical protein
MREASRALFVSGIASGGMNDEAVHRKVGVGETHRAATLISPPQVTRAPHYCLTLPVDWR